MKRNLGTWLVEQLDETHQNTIVITFGRYNPPTVGHAKLFDKAYTIARENNAKHLFITSKSHDYNKNPLRPEQKMFYLNRFWPQYRFAVAHTLMDVLKYLSKEYTKLIIVCGEDRKDGYQFVHDYNGDQYDFDEIEVISIGERDPDSDGIEGISASKQREHAMHNDFSEFMKGIPSNVSANDARKLFIDVQNGIRVNEQMVSAFVSKHNINDLLTEGSRTATVKNSSVDDGPRYFYGNQKSYQKKTKEMAELTGFEVLNYLLKDTMQFEIHPTDFPDGPPLAVSYFPVGVANKKYAGTDYLGKEYKATPAYEKWKTYIKRVATQVGYMFINFVDADAAKNYETRGKKESLYERFDIRETVGMILEGGAAGHMKHPFELPNVQTGDDLIEVFEAAVQHLETQSGSVKLDGVNVSIRLANINGKKQFVIDRGSKKELDVRGVTIDDLESRFGIGHGLVTAGKIVLTIFNRSLPHIRNELSTLGLMDDDSIMINIEYVKGQTNVQTYEQNFIAIHGLMRIETVTRETKTGAISVRRESSNIPYNKEAMRRLIENIKSEASRLDFDVFGDVETTMTRKPDLDSVLREQYSINYNGSKIAKSLAEWLYDLHDIPEQDDRINMMIDGVSKRVPAISKQVYLEILQGGDVVNMIPDDDDRKRAISGFIAYLATEKMGDEILETLDSEIGSLSQHEGVVINDLYHEPFKITGKFIRTGMVSGFRS